MNIGGAFRRVRRATAALGLLCSAACSSDPDVVVSEDLQRDDASYSVLLVHGCKEGRYSGHFVGKATTLNSTVDLSGDIEFTLYKSQQFEFLTLTRSALTGEVGSLNLRFQAAVTSNDSSSCSDQHLEASLVDGKLELSTGSLDFGGRVGGDYDPAGEEFNGTWTADFGEQVGLAADGNWWAKWIAAE